jgi:hypothetical protein
MTASRSKAWNLTDAEVENGSLSGCMTTATHPVAALSTASADTTPDQAEDMPNDEGFDFKDAPLLVLVRAASMTEEAQSNPSMPTTTPPATINSEAGHVPHVSENLMLKEDDLLTLLAATEQYWPIWPPWQYGTLSSTMFTLQNGGIGHAAHFLSQALRSSSRTIAAKALLWLSLCIHQAPRTLQLSSCVPSLTTLLELYMRTVDDLLASASGKHEILDAIEARLIQQKLFVDKGQPRQAWLCIRRAADGALLLRLHRAAERKHQVEREGGDVDISREEAIYTEIWQLETSLTLILGLPSTVPAPIDANNTSSYVPLHAFHRRMFSLAAAVVAQTQSQEPDYTTTQQISRELDACRALMPESWWHEPSPNLPFAQLYAQQATKIQYFLIIKLLHLPFMLSTDARLQESKTAAIVASRGLIAAYLGLRGYADDNACSSGSGSGSGWGWGLFVVCESLEFQAFSAGITLLVRLLSRDDDRHHNSSETEDWSLIQGLTVTLQRTAFLMRCDVASQAAEALGFLTQAARGAYHGPDRYDVVLPYFGKMSISLCGPSRKTPVNLDEEHPLHHLQAAPSGTVEFRANPSDLFHLPSSVEGELGGDWSAMAADVDIGWEWTQTFAFDNNSYS